MEWSRVGTRKAQLSRGSGINRAKESRGALGVTAKTRFSPGTAPTSGKAFRAGHRGQGAPRQGYGPDPTPPARASGPGSPLPGLGPHGRSGQTRPPPRSLAPVPQDRGGGSSQSAGRTTPRSLPGRTKVTPSGEHGPVAKAEGTHTVLAPTRQRQQHRSQQPSGRLIP